MVGGGKRTRKTSHKKCSKQIDWCFNRDNFSSSQEQCMTSHVSNQNNLYNQSQILMKGEVPSTSAVDKHVNIPLFAALPGVNYIDVQNGMPQKSQLIERGWQVVSMGVSKERTVNYRIIVGTNDQYYLKRKYIRAHSDLSVTCGVVQLCMIMLHRHRIVN